MLDSSSDVIVSIQLPPTTTQPNPVEHLLLRSSLEQWATSRTRNQTQSVLNQKHTPQGRSNPGSGTHKPAPSSKSPGAQHSTKHAAAIRPRGQSSGEGLSKHRALSDSASAWPTLIISLGPARPRPQLGHGARARARVLHGP